MKTLKTLALVLLLASSAHAGGKRHVQFDICVVSGGRVVVRGHSPKQAPALAVAAYLDESKADGGAHHFVVVEELADSGDSK